MMKLEMKMSEFRLSFPACLIAGKNRLSADDLSILRSVTFPNGLRSSADAAMLLALHRAGPDKCEEWRQYFLDSLSDFVVRFSYPQGSLDEINVAWLTRMLSNDGILQSPLELDLVLRIIDTSANVPPELSVFALEQLRAALAGADGAYRLARAIDRPGITRHDLSFVRRVLRTAVNGSQMALSPIEIAMLERIDQSTRPGENHPGWAELMSAIQPRHGEDRRAWRWLRVPDEMFKDDAA